jgi:hypothetical protein
MKKAGLCPTAKLNYRIARMARYYDRAIALQFNPIKPRAGVGEERAPPPSWWKAFKRAAFLRSPVINFVALYCGAWALVAVYTGRSPKLVWAHYGFFMAGVSVILEIVQRAQLIHFNQTLMWLGAPDPPLDIKNDKPTVCAEWLRILFGLLALGTIWARW